MDYQGNSKKNKEGNPESPPGEKNLEKVVVGEVILKPPGVGAKLKGIFLGGDIKTAGQFVLAEVVFPALRNLTMEIINKGSDRIIYGDSPRRRGQSYSYGPRVQYNNPIYRQDPRNRAYLPDQRPVDRWNKNERVDLDNIIVSSKADADLIIERLIDVVDVYEVVSVADLYELLGLPCPHIYNKWGWTHLANISSQQVREGYKISLPPLEEIS